MDQFKLHAPTDTVYPQEEIPIYLIHTLQQPFCSHPDCWCRANNQRKIRLLNATQNNELVVYQVTNTKAE